MAQTTRIPEGKKRITITLKENEIEAVQELADKNRRKVSDEIAILIEKYILNQASD